MLKIFLIAIALILSVAGILFGIVVLSIGPPHYDYGTSSVILIFSCALTVFFLLYLIKLNKQYLKDKLEQLKYNTPHLACWKIEENYWQRFVKHLYGEKRIKSDAKLFGIFTACVFLMFLIIFYFTLKEIRSFIFLFIPVPFIGFAIVYKAVKAVRANTFHKMLSIKYPTVYIAEKAFSVAEKYIGMKDLGKRLKLFKVVQEADLFYFHVIITQSNGKSNSDIDYYIPIPPENIVQAEQISQLIKSMYKIK